MYLHHQNSFDTEASFQSIATGVTSDSSNPDRAEEVGDKILQSKEVKDALKKKNRVVLMNTKRLNG